MFWVIEAEIRQRQQTNGPDAKVIDRLARDLGAEFPEHRGFDRSNLS